MAKFIIDPGHGGSKPGAVYDPNQEISGDEIEEEDINLEVGLVVASLLRDKKHQALLSRDADVDITLSQRRDMLHRFNADALISIHCNASTNPNINGVEAFYRDDIDFPLANIIGKALAQMTGLKDRGIFQDESRLGKRLTVLDQSPSKPAALIEIGFNSNKRDRDFITANILTIGEIIAEAAHGWAIQKRLV